MDLNYYVHNVLLSTDEFHIQCLAAKVYERVMEQDDFDSLHPEDQMPWIEQTEATVWALQQQLLAFNQEF